MDCRDCARLVNAWLDGELDALTAMKFDGHLRECPGCARRTEALKSIGAVVRDSPLYAPAPAWLDKRVRTTLRRQAGVRTWWRGAPVRWGAIAAAVLLAGFIGWSLPHATVATDHLVAQEVLSAHLRSLMADHLVDVVSSDRHTVKPWFAGRIDFSPDVRDCAADGFPLQGGRLEYVDGRPVAALVYRRDKHVINLFVWPSRDPAAGTGSDSLNGYHELHWTRGGLTYWAVSDAAEPTLRAFADCITRQPSTGPTGG